MMFADSSNEETKYHERKIVAYIGEGEYIYKLYVNK